MRNNKVKFNVVTLFVTVIFLSILTVSLYPKVTNRIIDQMNKEYIYYGNMYDLALGTHTLYYESVRYNVDQTITPSKLYFNDQLKVENDRNDNNDFNEVIYNNFDDILLNNNLSYFAVDHTYDYVKTNVYGARQYKNVDQFIKNLGNEFQFYVTIQVDENGNFSVLNSKNIDNNIFFKELLSRHNEYLMFYTDDLNVVKPVKNMTIVYATDVVYSYTYMNGTYIMEQYIFQHFVSITALVLSFLLMFVLLINKSIREHWIVQWINKISIDVLFIGIVLVLLYCYATIESIYYVYTYSNVSWVFGSYLKIIGDSQPIGQFIIDVVKWLLIYGITTGLMLRLIYFIRYSNWEYEKNNLIIIKGFNWLIINMISALSTKNKRFIILSTIIINVVFVVLLGAFQYSGYGVLITLIYTTLLLTSVFIAYRKINKEYVQILRLTKEINSGNLDAVVEGEDLMFKELKDTLLNIQTGFKKAIQEEIKSQTMKTELITNVSHDLKTPLTSIITYVDLLKNNPTDELEREKYVDVIDRKSKRLKTLIEDLFEMSKATSGNIEFNKINVDVVSLINQTIFEFNEQLETSQLQVRKNIPEHKVNIYVDPQKMFRALENVIGNTTKYAMKGSRVYIDVVDDEHTTTIEIKNVSATELDFDPNDIVERFVRGDKARNTEGSGLGLAIAKSFVELQGGTFDIAVDGDLFKVIIIFPKIMRLGE